MAEEAFWQLSDAPTGRSSELWGSQGKQRHRKEEQRKGGEWGGDEQWMNLSLSVVERVEPSGQDPYYGSGGMRLGVTGENGSGLGIGLVDGRAGLGMTGFGVGNMSQTPASEKTISY